jgi:hypothetical protein
LYSLQREREAILSLYNIDSITVRDRSKYLLLVFQISISLIKKKIKFSSYIGKFGVEQLQSHIWLTASSYIRKPFLICDFATAPLWISLYMKKMLFYFYQCSPSPRLAKYVYARSLSTQSEGKEIIIFLFSLALCTHYLMGSRNWHHRFLLFRKNKKDRV